MEATCTKLFIEKDNKTQMKGRIKQTTDEIRQERLKDIDQEPLLPVFVGEGTDTEQIDLRSRFVKEHYNSL